MMVKNKNKSIAPLILVSLAIVFVGVFLIEYLLNNPISHKINVINEGLLLSPTDSTLNNNEESIDRYANSNEAHWSHMPVTYKFFNPENCGDYQKGRIIKAFNKINLETNSTVNFEAVEITPDIAIYCENGFPDSEKVGYSIAGLAGANSEGLIIKNASITFFNTGEDTYSGGCPVYPDIEVHEILHTFGIGHNNNRTHIMNEEHIYCPNHINLDIIQKLGEIYNE